MKAISIIALLALSSITGIPANDPTPKPIIKPIETLLTPPTNYDLIYAYDSVLNYNVLATPAAFTAHTGYEVRYGRSNNDIYYDYTSGSGGASGQGFNNSSYMLTGLSITMVFKRSNSTWSSRSGGASWVPQDVMGSNSNVGTTVNKWSMALINSTSHRYTIYFDASSLNGDFMDYADPYVINVTYSSSFQVQATIQDGALAGFIIPALTSFVVSISSTDVSVGLDAFYIRDEGMDSFTADYYNDGYDDGYDDAYSSALISYISAYSSIYNEGLTAGNSNAYEQGFNDGSNDSFLANIENWIVPAIIIVMFVGGAFSIIAWKRKQE